MSPLELLQYDFLRHAVLVGLLAGILCGIVGTFVVVKRLVFVSGGVTHAAFGGLGICFFLGLDPRLGAAVVAVLSGWLLAGGERRGRSHDATIGVLWSVGMAVGIVFLARTPGYAPNLMTYLFGSILTVRGSDVLLTAGLTVAVAGVLAAYYKELVAVAFDEDFAAVQGVPVRRVMLFMMTAIALTVVFLIQLVGIILVIALLTIPPLVALRWAGSFPATIAVASVVAVATTLGGLAVSYAADLPSGPAIVLLGAVVLAASRLLGRRRSDPGAAREGRP